jgi:hypothetical protein
MVQEPGTASVRTVILRHDANCTYSLVLILAEYWHHFVICYVYIGDQFSTDGVRVLLIFLLLYSVLQTSLYFHFRIRLSPCGMSLFFLNRLRLCVGEAWT